MDFIEYLRSIESKYNTDPCYMDKQKYITADNRAVVVDWFFSIRRKWNIMHETVYLAVNIMDRFLSIGCISIQRLQLLGIASLFIAYKYFEDSMKYGVDMFLGLAKQIYTKYELLRMESIILSRLEFSLTVSTTFNFLKSFLDVSQSSDIERNTAYYLADISLTDYRQLQFKPSTVAYACFRMARRVSGVENDLDFLVKYASTYDMKCMDIIGDNLDDLYRRDKHNGPRPLMSSINEYKEESKFSVSKICLERIERIKAHGV